MTNIIETILNYVYPNVCGFCDEICKENICPNCKQRLGKYKREQILYTFNKSFDELIYLYEYGDLIRERLIKYKFNEKAYIYKAFADAILNSKKICEKIKTCDIIVPVPIHRVRLIERGYNQSTLIAKEIAKNTCIELESRILLKCKNNKPQSTLSGLERKNNIKNVYIINTNEQYKIANKRVLIFDDIYTTGATINECSKVLKKYGAKEVIALVIAKD